MSRLCGVSESILFVLYLASSSHIIGDKQAREMSCPVILAIQNPCLALSCSVLATKIALWPESGHNFAQSGHKFSCGDYRDIRRLSFALLLHSTVAACLVFFLFSIFSFICNSDRIYFRCSQGLVSFCCLSTSLKFMEVSQILLLSLCHTLFLPSQ